jgi:predicted aspartyl protease
LGHVRIDVKILGQKGAVELKNILVDTGATYTVLPPEIINKVDLVKTSLKTPVKIVNGRIVEGTVYVGEVEFKQRKGPAIIIGVSGAEPVLGVQVLETLGFKVNPVTGELEYAIGLTVNPSKNEYTANEILSLSGIGNPFSLITLQLFDPRGDRKAIAQVQVKEDGKWEIPNMYKFTSEDLNGTWEIKAYQNGVTTVTKFKFEV